MLDARNRMTDFDRRIQTSLSSRLKTMAEGFAEVQRAKSCFSEEDFDAIVSELRQMVRDARQFEGTGSGASNSVTVAFEAICKAEDELKIARRLMSRWIGEPKTPFDHASLVRSIGKSIAFHEAALETIARGVARP